MKDKEDPFLSVMDFLDSKSERSKKLSLGLEKVWDGIICNAIWLTYLLGASFVALIIASPYLLGSDDSTLVNVGAFMHVLTGIIQLCHQLPYRSFMVGGVPFPVCARDIGIYIGIVAGFATILLPKKPPILSRWVLPIACTFPIAIDGITQTILMLRESNNALRFITGLIFAFGIFAYIANRFIERRYPMFRQAVTHTAALVSVPLIALFIVWGLLAGMASQVEGDYMMQGQAIEAALNLTSIDEPAHVRAYFIGSMASLSIMGAPYYENHRGNVGDILREAEFSKKRLAIYMGEQDPKPVPENATSHQILSHVASEQHKLGIWAVAVLTEEPVRGAAAFVEQGSGEYYLFDGYTHELILSTSKQPLGGRRSKTKGF